MKYFNSLASFCSNMLKRLSDLIMSCFSCSNSDKILSAHLAIYVHPLKITHLLVFSLCIQTTVFSQSKKEQIELLKQQTDSLIELLRNERVELSNTSNSYSVKVKNLVTELDKLRGMNVNSESILEEKNREVDKLQNNIKEQSDTIRSLRVRIREAKKTGYRELEIGNQIWMSENLNVSNFRNGDPIPYAATKEQWLQARSNKQPAWCYYNNDSTFSSGYGKLYNWYAVNDSRGLAPENWRIPSDIDWEILIETLEGAALAGQYLKSTKGWSSAGTANQPAGFPAAIPSPTNSSGMSLAPGGNRNYDGTFDGLGKHGRWWSSSEPNTNSLAWCRTLNLRDHVVLRQDYNKGLGLSVRCIGLIKGKVFNPNEKNKPDAGKSKK
jgi:uncharacterized protein (TIGR02145 family)